MVQKRVGVVAATAHFNTQPDLSNTQTCVRNLPSPSVMELRPLGSRRVARPAAPHRRAPSSRRVDLGGGARCPLPARAGCRRGGCPSTVRSHCTPGTPAARCTFPRRQPPTSGWCTSSCGRSSTGRSRSESSPPIRTRWRTARFSRTPTRPVCMYCTRGV